MAGECDGSNICKCDSCRLAAECRDFKIPPHPVSTNPCCVVSFCRSLPARSLSTAACWGRGKPFSSLQANEAPGQGGLPCPYMGRVSCWRQGTTQLISVITKEKMIAAFMALQKSWPFVNLSSLFLCHGVQKHKVLPLVAVRMCGTEPGGIVSNGCTVLSIM